MNEIKLFSGDGIFNTAQKRGSDRSSILPRTPLFSSGRDYSFGSRSTFSVYNPRFSQSSSGVGKGVVVRRADSRHTKVGSDEVLRNVWQEDLFYSESISKPYDVYLLVVICFLSLALWLGVLAILLQWILGIFGN